MNLEYGKVLCYKQQDLSKALSAEIWWGDEWESLNCDGGGCYGYGLGEG